MAAVVEATAIWDRFDNVDRLAINYTLTCNISCAHCIVDSSPHRKERLETDEVKRALDDGRRMGKRHVTFSGGEVFLFPKPMCEVIAYAKGIGFVVDVESNAFWARSEQIAQERLQPFVDAGISGLSLSADAYHVEHFPVDRAITASKVGRSFGLVTEINFCPSGQTEVDASIKAALLGAGEPFLENELLDRGRGKDVCQIKPRRSIQELPDCDSLTRTVHATGDVYACCELDTSTDAMKRTPVFLGSLRSEVHAAQEQDRRERIVTSFHDPRSPAYFRTLIREHPSFQALDEAKYQNICDLCLNALKDPQRIEVIDRLLHDNDGESASAK